MARAAEASDASEGTGGITEQLSGYLAMVAGLRRATREKAAEMAHDVLAQAGLDEVATDAQQRVGRLTDEIVAAGRANRSMVQSLIRAEVDKAIDRALARLHFARAEDVATLRAQLDDLQSRLDQLDVEQSGAAGWSTGEPAFDPAPFASADPIDGLDDDPVVATGAARAAAGRVRAGGPGPAQKLAQQAAVKRAAAKKASATKAPADKPPAKKASAEKAPAKKSPAKKSPAARVPVDRAPGKKAAAKKSSTAGDRP